ncbi:integrase [Zoogloea oleivorans]|uniref:Integrase n=1 Tax=Zoogloea oleivorans TaxID=1552750 RepID=A0A6C2CD96_9RHOO|nr:phage integrase family protein [Zoogloea oleivorans]TYC51383.1 integrase [Zoogloea oleivorans]
MAQNTVVAPEEPHYTRADFTALRASLNKLDISFIAGNYYTEDDLEELGCESPSDLQGRLDDMRDHLINRASAANPHIADALRNARKSARWSKVALDFLFQAAEFHSSQPQPSDSVTAWLKPRVAKHLQAEGVRTLQDLHRLIELRGPSWWRPVPRLGEGKAASILRWLQRHEKTLGRLTVIGTKTASDAALPAVVLDPHGTKAILVPLDGIRLPAELDGSTGINRADKFSLIYARNDLEAVQAYLVKFKSQSHTFRAYQKELERLLLWAIYKRRRPLSSLLIDDCELYKLFLAAPDPEWIGPRTKRWSPRWKPFEGPLSPASQQHAVTIVRGFFTWLQDVRYLAGNPWIAVANPRKEKPIESMQIDKALPEDLWKELSREGGYLDQAIAHRPGNEQAQMRLGKAALLLIGHSGIRREEAATATRGRLKMIVNAGIPLAELAVLGKGLRWRTVFMPDAAVQAIREHWEDRGQDFDDLKSHADSHLLSPIIIPSTPTASQKHLQEDSGQAHGFVPGSLWRIVTKTLKTVADDQRIEMTNQEREILRHRATHALRHTFATVAVGNEVPLDVMQKLLGHASLDTTSIYVQAERKRSIAEMSKFFGGDKQGK